MQLTHDLLILVLPSAPRHDFLCRLQQRHHFRPVAQRIAVIARRDDDPAGSGDVVRPPVKTLFDFGGGRARDLEMVSQGVV